MWRSGLLAGSSTWSCRGVAWAPSRAPLLLIPLPRTAFRELGRIRYLSKLQMLPKYYVGTRPSPIPSELNCLPVALIYLNSTRMQFLMYSLRGFFILSDTHRMPSLGLSFFWSRVLLLNDFQWFFNGFSMVFLVFVMVLSASPWFSLETLVL